MAKEIETKKVKLRILSYVGSYVPNQEVELDEETAKHLLTATTNLPARAMLLSDALTKDAYIPPIESLSVAEASELGIKNAPTFEEPKKAKSKKGEDL